MATAAATGQPQRRIYHTLDGMRGIAALLVALRHGDGAFGTVAFAASFLAVDLFFVISGVVVAQAYEARLVGSSLGLRAFALIRLIRLWPLYVLGTALGLIALSQDWLQPDLSARALAMLAPAALLMLPAPFGLIMFPANGPTWSLFYEMLVNVAYAALVRWLSNRVLVGLVVIGAGLCIAASRTGTSLDSGWTYDTVWIGFARVTFSFFLGVLILRCAPRLQLPFRVPALLCLVASGLVLVVPPDTGYSHSYHLLAVLIVFPVLVVLALNSDPPGWLRPICRILGVASYAIYVLHYALLAVLRVLFRSLPLHPPLSGFVMLAIVVAIALLADRFYDAPVRRWLAQRLQSRRAREIADRSARAEQHLSR